MADRIVEVRDGEAHGYVGGYSEWLARRDGPAVLAAGGRIGA